jgi:hypothetical protein
MHVIRDKVLTLIIGDHLSWTEKHFVLKNTVSYFFVPLLV